MTRFDEKEVENCCSNQPIYEVTYRKIARKWLVCIVCIELDCFKHEIQEKVRISK